ncbi:hypothetical protein E3N88_36428 [Mikania micrantha]|uniref:Uncharacterized protein n=1 Tax=Mikania micrantha TaxID=192012 RepID=A0A5N6M485_9ASTR|nr:hypothetical protein E3N88_36428 [Mikania micrantha]
MDSDASVSGNLASSNPLYLSSRTTTGVVSPRRTMACDSFPVIRFLQAPVTTVLEYPVFFDRVLKEATLYIVHEDFLHAARF